MDTHPQAVITGAASGIGAAFARLCAEQSHDLLLVDRNATALAELSRELAGRYAVAVETRVVDLASAAELNALAAAIAQRPRIDLLVNSAGVPQPAPVLEMDPARLADMVAIHCTATVILCRAAATRMVARGQGAIINVAALGALVNMGVLANYGATKSYVIAFTRGLGRELRGTGVYAQAFCPGHTRTNIHTSDDTHYIPEIFFSEADQVVRASWSAMQRRQTVCVPGLRHRMLWLFAKLGLGRIAWRVALKAERLLGIKSVVKPAPAPPRADAS
ncbi:MAG: SDR family NAD(P)-dependent oxidoreductase [Lentisphaerae bacterium]|nr:SDR family NAD(P)-dependent oxidoreductase [Lentisphaerota bacterium]